VKRIFFAVLLVLLLAGGAYWWVLTGGLVIDPFVATYTDNCSNCHGENLEGVADKGPALLNTHLLHGDSVTDIGRSIAQGFPGAGMSGWAEELSEDEIRSIAIYIAERRVDRLFTDFKVDAKVAIPETVVTSDLHDFRVEVVTDQLHPLPFSIAPLPDGRILVSEKTRGLRIVASDGSISGLITGTPEVFDDGWNFIIEWGHGWLLDVALHPDYANNGWIYLHHTERCTDCTIIRKSINRVVRGRIHDGQWVDEEVIWAPGPEHYSLVPDVGAGGRLAFDDKGYLYISVGVKGSSNFDGIQNLQRPAGKIHRVHDDGRIPVDNPFANLEGAFPSTWTYGHRSPQGLEFNRATGKLWSTEMGPRGGDELNLLLPGRNYGWPLHSKGLNYDGTNIEYGKLLDIDFNLNDIEQPIVDLTPAPAVSSFVFYQGDQFPAWKGHALVGSLKATELYRIVVDDDRFTYSEVLLKQLARIRDIEVGADGSVYLLLEHAGGGQIVRLVRVNPPG
jgi:glucose/arabinose dehydrogenase/cytochrome c553